MINQILITFFGWLALVLIGINLVGMLVRRLVSNPEMEKLAAERHEFVKKLAKEHQEAEKKVNYVALALILIYLGVLFYFWNIGVVIATIMIMIARIPDLLWEMKHGRAKIKDMPPIYMLTLLIILAALPVLWYALY